MCTGARCKMRRSGWEGGVGLALVWTCVVVRVSVVYILYFVFVFVRARGGRMCLVLRMCAPDFVCGNVLALYSVGSNAHGQLGHGDLAPRGFFECIAPIRGKGVDKVYAGSDYAMMLTEDNEVRSPSAATRDTARTKFALVSMPRPGLRLGRRRVCAPATKLLLRHKSANVVNKQSALTTVPCDICAQLRTSRLHRAGAPIRQPPPHAPHDERERGRHRHQRGLGRRRHSGIPDQVHRPRAAVEHVWVQVLHGERRRGDDPRHHEQAPPWDDHVHGRGLGG